MTNFAWFCVFTAVSFVAGAALAAAALVLLPEDYFDRDEASDARRAAAQHPAWRWTVRIARNVLGAALIVLGIVMLFMPGQGVLTIVCGVMLVDLPGKRQLVGKLLARPKLLDAANAWRAKFGRPPLRAPSD